MEDTEKQHFCKAKGKGNWLLMPSNPIFGYTYQHISKKDSYISHTHAIADSLFIQSIAHIEYREGEEFGKSWKCESFDM